MRRIARNVETSASFLVQKLWASFIRAKLQKTGTKHEASRCEKLHDSREKFFKDEQASCSKNREAVQESLVDEMFEIKLRLSK